VNQYQSLREAAWECNRALPETGLVVQAFGNASALDRAKGVFAIKPSGVSFAQLKPEEMVIVDLEGRTIDGTLRPSTDTRTHALLYRHWPEIEGIVHTHSPYAVAWAQAMRPIPVLGTTHADSLAREVPCTLPMSEEMIAGDYEEQTGHQILKAFAGVSPGEVEMVLVAGHGPFTWGASVRRALENSVLLEQIARLAYLTLQINPGIPPLGSALLKKHFQRKHGPDAYYGQGGS
jgi:L-ribulose-5-phosphate 4-epimerase